LVSARKNEAMPATLSEWFVLAVLIWATGYMLWWAPPMLFKALRTGRLPARGVTYNRHSQPRRYWFGIWFWLAMIALFVFATCVMLYGLMLR
jgi:uncharacterized membrane protein